MKQNTNILCKQLSYQFKQPELLVEALTHRSAAAKNNERLEFLGDGVLNFVIGAELYRIKPSANEGELSRFRATLVRMETLAELGRTLNLGDYLIMSSGELKSGGFQRSSTIADTVEAILGAVYLDSGFDVCQQLILRLYSRYLDGLPDSESLKDPKTRLQEYLQSRKQSLPEYTLISSVGKAHEQVFLVECRILMGEIIISEGKSTSRRKAEQCAAEEMNMKLGVK